MDARTLDHFAHIKRKGAAYSTLHFCSSVSVRHTDLYLSVCFRTAIFKCLSVSLLLYNSGFSSAPSPIELKLNKVIFHPKQEKFTLKDQIEGHLSQLTNFKK